MTEFIPPGTRWFELPSPFPMKRGGELHGARVAYETWGTLSPAADNAILIVTGLSPDAHAAANPGNPEPGWWDWMIGPGKPIDTDRWFVVCVNSLGSCKGSTGPASNKPGTDALYRLDFPELSIEDGADASVAVVRALAIGVHTDILFPLQQQQEIANGLRDAGCDATFLPLPSPQGHDAFLVDSERFGPAVRDFLAD